MSTRTNQFSFSEGPDGERAKALMVPFANLGRWYGSEAERVKLLPTVPAPEDPVQPDTEAGGYRAGVELQKKKYPVAVWVKVV